jgi:predicted patatin/cPLA2 family phospholipase
MAMYMIRKIIQLTGGCEQVASNKSKHADLVKLSPFLYQKKTANFAKPENENEMRRVFPEETMKRLRVLKKKHDPEDMFKTGAWQYEANT